MIKTVMLIIHITLITWLINLINCMCPSRCVCADEKLSVNCKDASLDFVPITLNPEARELFLSQNRIKSISESFSFYKNLKFLDLSHNQLASLGGRHFGAQNGLQYLLLNHNRLTNLDHESLIGLSSLTFLNLNENLFTHLADNIFYTLKSLEKLDLSSNLLTSISPSTFAGLTNLKSLSLRNNKFTQVPSNSFKPLITLFKLDLGHNSIEAIDLAAFQYCYNLVDLRLDKCLLKNLSTNFLHNLSSLRWLHLDNNLIVTINPDWFVSTNRLENLVLNNNQLVTLIDSPFFRLNSLRRLDLRNNPQLATLDESSFNGLYNLTRLLLDMNPSLTYLPDNLFNDCKKTLLEVTLRGSSVATISEQLIDSSSIKFIDLRENPLNCNCSLLWLWKYYKKSNFTTKTFSQNLLCASPQRLFARQLLTLSEGEIFCDDWIAKRAILSLIFVAFLLLLLMIITLVIKCRDRLPFIWHRHDKLNSKLREEDLISEKRRILENQVIFPPPSPYHPSCSLVYVRPPIRAAPISQV